MQRAPQYDDEVVSIPGGPGRRQNSSAVVDYGGSDPDDDMFKDAVRVVISPQSFYQPVATTAAQDTAVPARVMEEMEEQGIIGAADGSRPREVLVSSLDDVFGATAPAALRPQA